MKSELFFGTFAIMALLSACQPTPQESPRLSRLIEQVKQAYAPDKRVAVWAITPVNKGGKWILRGETNLPEAQAALRGKLDSAGISVIDSILLLPAAALQNKTYGLVNLSVANIRSEPRHSAELATQSTLGTPLRVYKAEGDWFYVQTPDGYLGWLDAGGFVQLSREELQAWQEGARVVFLDDYGLAWNAPSSTATPVSDLLAGNILLQNAAPIAGWVAVTFPDGRTGFVPEGAIMSLSDWLTSRQPTAENILRSAQELMGRPYLWGGTSAKAMDCSGFTKTVFYLNGLLLPRDASQQVHVGAAIDEAVSIDQLQPGDLLFFGRAATTETPEKITHVAIYQGSSKIIHATGRVQVQSLNPEDPDFAPDRLATFIRAKRILATPGQNGVPWLKDVTAYQAQWKD